MHAHVIRPYSHSLSDDERLYKTPAERQAEAERDPVMRFPKFLIDEGMLDRHMLQRITHEIDEEVHAATDQALRDDPPAPESAMRHLYSDTVDPTSADFAAQPHYRGEPMTMVDLINATLREEMRRNPDDAGFRRRRGRLQPRSEPGRGEGQGRRFQGRRAGCSASSARGAVSIRPWPRLRIVGRAIGMATRGLKPVAEIQFFDYIWPAMMQIRDELATMRWRSNGALRVPRGDSRAHWRISQRRRHLSQPVRRSRSSRTVPGLRVVMPSNALDACGLLRTALRCGRPGAVSGTQEALSRAV